MQNVAGPTMLETPENTKTHAKYEDISGNDGSSSSEIPGARDPSINCDYQSLKKFP